MAYIQMTLLGISAEVCHGDTLLMKTWTRWRTIMSMKKGYTVDGINAYRTFSKEFCKLAAGTPDVIEAVPKLIEESTPNIIETVPEIMETVPKMITFSKQFSLAEFGK
jgi:hypothetical protein